MPTFNIQVDNPAPSISGTPTKSLTVNTAYSFIPAASDANGDKLTFSITNKPTWAKFSTTTGALTGTPLAKHVGITKGIVIAVTDGKTKVSLSAFDLQVSLAAPNKAPMISGTPANNVTVGASYSFTPTASDEDTTDTLTFSITNKPTWATFDATTGKLSGTPVAADVATTRGIVISVSDGKQTVSLPAFALRVMEPINLARQFGVATQKSTYNSSSAASNAIDGNLTTTNHTNCEVDDWWQVKLPDSTQVSRIVVTGRDTWTSRLNGAEVYVSANSATNGGMTAGDKVFTLAGTANAQNILLTTPKSGAYVIVKAAAKAGGTECLHMREVEVYGQSPATPALDLPAYRFQLSNSATSAILILPPTTQSRRLDVVALNPPT